MAAFIVSNLLHLFYDFALQEICIASEIVMYDLLA